MFGAKGLVFILQSTGKAVKQAGRYLLPTDGFWTAVINPSEWEWLKQKGWSTEARYKWERTGGGCLLGFGTRSCCNQSQDDCAGS